MITYINQLKLMGVFEQISGILLGTFMKLEAAEQKNAMLEYIKGCVGIELPIAVTREIGHGTDSKAIIIGKNFK